MKMTVHRIIMKLCNHCCSSAMRVTGNRQIELTHPPAHRADR